MAASGDLPSPLMIVCLLFVAACALPLPADDFEDYAQLYDTPAPPKSNSTGGKSQRCDYNPCLDDQPLCSEMVALSGCLCPGSTPSNVAPEAPSLRAVSWNGSAVVVRWCAPFSFVTSYVVTVGGEERQRFGMRRRSGAVGDVERASEVCVVAANGAGDSKGSCATYEPSDGGVALKAGLIGGALGLLLLGLLAALLWRRRRQRKQEAAISMQ